MPLFNFDIRSSSIISKKFRERSIYTFIDACSYVRNLPYKRNLVKNNPTAVLEDSYGTCSTKHALLCQLAIENEVDAVKLKLGIFKMSESNTPQIKSTLEKYNLTYIPEAHNYLSVNGVIIDCTKENFGINNFVSDLISEIEIQPKEIIDFKVDYHKNILKNWLVAQPDIKLSLNELWSIREQCIKDISS